MDNSKFKEAYKKLNQKQKAAVDAIEGSVMVSAGPGTGKTQILILRIAKILLETQIEPENILALTFTESAVYEIRERLVNLIGTAGFRVGIYTFHGFCNTLIKKREDEFEHLVRSESIDELGQIRMIENILEKGTFQYIKPFGDPLFYVRSIQRAIGQLKQEGIEPADFLIGITKQEQELQNTPDLYHQKGIHKGKMKGIYYAKNKKIQKNKELFFVYKQYEDELKKEQRYDYNDMLIHVLSVFKSNKELLLDLQELFQYVLIDEHQDTNKAQNKIIEYICSFDQNPNLFVVGDSAQAIFRFQGATLENFLYFKHLYPSALFISLEYNYRSGQRILDAALSLISHNKKNEVKENGNNLIASESRGLGNIRIAAFLTYYGEYYFLAQEIKRLLALNEKPEEIAILVRNNKDVDQVITMLRHEQIPYTVESDQYLFHDISVEKMLTLLMAIHELGSDHALVEAMYLDFFKIDPLDIIRLIEFAKINRMFLWDILSLQTYKKRLKLKSSLKILRFVRLLKNWKKKSMNDAVDALFIHVLNESGFLKQMMHDDLKLEKLDKISVLFGEIKKKISQHHSFSLGDFLEHIELLKKHHISPLSSTAYVSSQVGVRIMTVHKSKGREFDYVYIINMYDGHWGNKQRGRNLFSLPWEFLSVTFDTDIKEEENDEERRLLYVAITRARKEVTLTFGKQNMEGKEQVLSQFIEEIPSKYKTELDSSGLESLLLRNPELYLLEKKKSSKNQKVKWFLQNKSYFRQLFIKRGLSVSGLNNYISCPWKYFFRNLLLLPDVKNKHMILGSGIHLALHYYFTHRNNTDYSQEQAIKEFETYLARQPLNDLELDELMKRGKNILLNYLLHKGSSFGDRIESELTISGIRLEKDIFLNGKIDMIERLDNKSNVVVYDFKTGKPKSRSIIEGKNNQVGGDYKRQLLFYHILLSRYKWGKRPLFMKEGVIEFVEPNEQGIYKSERFEINPEEVKKTEELILRISTDIVNLSFLYQTCKDKECYYCKLRTYLLEE